MSEAISALNTATWEDGAASVADIGPQGMISLRGDLGSAALKKAVKAAVGTAVPDTRAILHGKDGAAAWMSPDELLLLCPYADVADRVAKINKALGKAHALAVDVSDARALFRVTAPNMREVLAKLAPVDMAPGAMEPGMMRRTRLAQVAAAFWIDDAATAHVVCFRSVADYAFGVLTKSAQQNSVVGFY